MKKDALPIAPIATGITYSVTPPLGERLRRYFDELEASSEAL